MQHSTLHTTVGAGAGDSNLSGASVQCPRLGPGAGHITSAALEAALAAAAAAVT